MVHTHLSRYCYCLFQIYCSGMNTSHPREYINIRSAEKDNYAEVFKKRLRRAATCPSGDARSPSCPDCLRSRDYSRAGVTHFNRVRINITSSHITVISKFDSFQHGYNK